MATGRSLTMQAVWLCIFFFLSLVQGHPTSSHFDVGSAKRDNAGSFAVGATRNHNVNRSGPRARLRALAKYGSGIPDALAKLAAEKGWIGNVAAYNQTDDREWLSPVSIGTPGQEVLLDFDTGSSDTWVFSSETKTSGVINGDRKIWAPERSSTATKVNNTSWEIFYGDGSYAEGTVWKDTLHLGSNISVPNIFVESATSVSRSMVTDTTLSGLLGLGFNVPIETSPLVPTFLNLITPSLDAPVFTVDLRWHTNGLYEFGRVDSTKYKGDVHYFPLATNASFWETPIQSFHIGGGTLYLKSQWRSIVDTGTTLILLQDDLARIYYANATAAGAVFNSTVDGFTFRCNSTLPDLHLGFGDENYIVTVPGKYLNYTDMTELGDGDMCYGGVQPVGDVPFSILGDVFLKAVYTVFDVGGARIGFAEKVLN